MTKFENVELIINQYLALSKEIDNSIAQEDYQEAAILSENKNKIIKKLYTAIRTADLSEEEKQKLSSIEDNISENEKKIIESLKKLKINLSDEVKSNKRKFKLTSAYAINTPKKQGVIINVSE